MRENKKFAWLDTNVVLRFLIRDHEKYFLAARNLFAKAEKGELSFLIHPLTVAELVWTLESFYEYEKKEIVNTLLGFIEAKGIEVLEKEITRKALLDYADKNVDYIDAYLAAYASQIGPQTIFTLDKKHFSRLEGDIKFLL
jgi:predicted nucleic acid-binding protein